MEWSLKMLWFVMMLYLQTDPVLMQCNIPNCITSNCTGDVCENCKDGYYLQTNGFCGHCPISCIKCRSLTNCTECIPERYGSYCYNNCPIGCKNRSCDDHTGRCREGCAPGYYLYGNNQCRACQLCINGSCDAISGSCDIGCIAGYYRSTTGGCSACSRLCKDHTCDRSTGACTKGCVDNHYLDNLGKCNDCPVSCKDRICEDRTAVCTNGCNDNYYMTAYQTCSYCPNECVDRKCHSVTGTCELGCVDQYYMTSYNVCQSCSSSCVNKLCHDKTAFCKEGCNEGYYLAGATCMSCSSRCKDKCADGTGACDQCKEGYYRDRNGNCQYCSGRCSNCSQDDGLVCYECDKGYWGDDCSMKCFEGCRSGFCHMTEGYCLNGCVDGYSDSLCNKPPREDCPVECIDRKCNSITCELGCIGQYYMASYNVCEPCSSNCINKLCHDETAYCKIGCIQGYYLASGTCKQCSSRCKAGCADVTGACDHCRKGHFMDLNGNCQSCPEQCSSCSQEHGEVVCNECKTGYWGDWCALKCFEGCNFDLCHITEGHCLKGCREEFSNSLCNTPPTRDIVITGLAVALGILGAVAIITVALYIIKKKRGGLCCLSKAKRADSKQKTEGKNNGPAIDSVRYVVSTCSPDDPNYERLSESQGCKHPIAIDFQ